MNMKSPGLFRAISVFTLKFIYSGGLTMSRKKENVYQVKITETLTMTVEVEAENESNAEQQVNDKWSNSEYILNADNFTGVTFEIVGNSKGMYETQEVKNLIPESIRSVLWFMLQELDAPHPKHYFELSATKADGDARQHIVHTQRGAAYRREFSFKCTNPIDMWVYIIGFGADNWLMLLQP